ncbi:mannose-ethanolamine phosphotransferase gpi13 [Aspergillus hancockii]|nr:mannose-ethanolamine phosphotransferase gpi13 [Aspergillus hancockii]
MVSGISLGSGPDSPNSNRSQNIATPLQSSENTDPQKALVPKALPGRQFRSGKGSNGLENIDVTLEREFKIKHLGSICVLGWILCLHIVGIFFFTKGFLLTRMVLETVVKRNEGCWHQKSFDKAIVIIIDALRYDFTVPFVSTPDSESAQLFHDNIPVLYETAVNTPENAFLLPFIADPPTTTLQRLKGLTTGTLPTFVDAGSNFAGTAIDEDNLVAQLRTAGKNLVHLGDDTWHNLFPGYFDPELTRPFDSFNVWDLHTVDNGVNDHLFPLLHPENGTKWDVIFGHYLGVDHAGHRYGPNHPAMGAKLKQMDQVIRDLIAKIDDKTLLVVMGDHGMDSKGDHGGESDDEVNAALWMYSKKRFFGRTGPETATPPKTAHERSIPQIDLVPTLSLLLGMPIPFNNLGSPIEEAFSGPSGNDWKNLVAVNRLTSAQIKRYQHEYAKTRGADDDQEFQSLGYWKTAEDSWQKLPKRSKSNIAAMHSVYNSYREYQRHTLDICRALWAKFHVLSMIQGIGILFAGLVLLVFYARGIRSNRTEITKPLLSAVGVGSGLGAVIAVVKSFYAGSKSYEGAASLWIGFGFRLGLFVTSIFWMLEGADDGEWFSLSKETLKSIRVFLAQLVLGLAFAAGITAFIYSKPCVSINVTKGNTEPESKNKSPSSPQQPGRTTVTILGFANIYGTRSFLLVVNFCLGIILMQKPMGQGAMGLLLWQILSLLEILDTNALVMNNSAIGPIVLALLGSFYFFKTGHQAVLSSIQWETAFIPLSTIKYPWSPILVTLNTFGPQILTAIAVPLTVLWKRPLQLHDQSKPTSSKPDNPAAEILSDVLQAACTYILYFATINLATTMWAGHLRRHLMLYRIFSPRFMMGAAVLGVVDIVLILFSVAGVRFSMMSVGEIFGW